MAKGPLVTDAAEALIATVYQKHPKWKAPAVRNEVSYILRKENPKLPRTFPSLSTVQKVLATVRKKVSEVDPEDKPWSMAALNGELHSEPITPEALLSVLAVWKYRIEKGEIFTIRQAKWSARLSGLLGRNEALAYIIIPAGVTTNAFNDPSLEGTKVLENVNVLSQWSEGYANAEYVAYIINRPFNTAALDMALLRLPGTAEDRLNYQQSQLKRYGKFMQHLAKRKREEITKEVKDNERSHNQEG